MVRATAFLPETVTADAPTEEIPTPPPRAVRAPVGQEFESPSVHEQLTRPRLGARRRVEVEQLLRETGLRLGARDYLLKPFDIQRVQDSVRWHLAGQGFTGSAAP